jgi:uncharacterized protein YgiM (DUF1202 family)
MSGLCHSSCFAIAVCAFAAITAASGSGRQMARVTEDRAALYAGIESPQESAAALLPAATVLEVCGDYDPAARLIPVNPPPSLALYIYRDLVKDGRVAVDKSQVRTGPSATAGVVGSLAKGDNVETKGVYGDWYKIAPPPQMRFWIAREQVETFIEMSEDEMVMDLLKRLHKAFSTPDDEQADTNAPFALPLETDVSR